jgi:hypothetical protein
LVGSENVGARVGEEVGTDRVGEMLGVVEGDSVGVDVGDLDGADIVGDFVGD